MSVGWPRRVSLHIYESADGTCRVMVAKGNEGDIRLTWSELSSQLGDLRGPRGQASALYQAAKKLASYAEQFNELP